jgi:hypothetical protein
MASGGKKDNHRGTTPANGRPGGRKIVGTYDYRDAQGNLLYQTVRYEPKEFCQRRSDKGGWAWSLGDVPRVLYRLPELLQNPERPVFVVEGEKDADRLHRLGLVATTGVCGANAAWLPAYTETLRGREVIVLPDNDDPGRRHADKVAKAITGVAASVKVVPLPDLPPKGDVSDWLDAAGNDKEKLLRLVLDAPDWQGSPSTSHGPDDDRPRIVITTDEHLVNEEAARAVARDPGVFQRGGQLVRVVRDQSPATHGVRRALAPRIEILPSPILRERLAANARFVTLRGKQNRVVEYPERPPAWSVAAVHARAEWPGVRHLEAVVDYPVLRPDGTILDVPGYDPATGLILEPAGPLPPIAASPSRQDALAARDALLEVVEDFPFQQAAHRSAWFAGLLTPPARFAFAGPAPLNLVDSNVRGAGKNLLQDCTCQIVTGERFTIATYTNDCDELRKRITSLALGGDRLVLFDNLEGKFGNGVLDAALTGTAWEDRLLGGNRMAKMPLYVTWYATGNNVAVAADTARRICHCRLETPEERPEERTGFVHPNLLAWVGQNRGRLLAAALTILRAYCVAGRPDMGLPAWGSFEGWSALVRSAVVWVGLPDPGETRTLLQEAADVTGQFMGVLLDCWQQLDPDRHGVTAADVIQRLYKSPPTPTPAFHDDMKDALEGLLSKPDARGLGFKLRSYRKRIFGGHFFDQCGSHGRAIRWGVFSANEFGR